MSIYDYCREFRYCPNCTARLTALPTKPDQNQTLPRHRTEHRIDPGVYNHSLEFLVPRNRRTTDEDGYCAECGEQPDHDLPRGIAGNQDVSLGELVARTRRLYRTLADYDVVLAIDRETVCDFVAAEKRAENPDPDEAILREAIEDVATGDIDTTRWTPVTAAAQTAMDDEARRSPISLPYRPVATDGGHPESR